MRLAVYGGISSLLALGVIVNAMRKRPNFYAACIYLSKSSACVMILLNMGLLLALCFGKALQALFFGDLRAIEVEHLHERSWYAVTETCLAMTIFREEFNIQFMVVFTTLLFLKIFHWLCQDRVEFMEQLPSNRFRFHARIVNLMALLLIVDCVLADHAIRVTMVKGPNMMVMFGFEYTILIWTMLSTIGKYAINVIDMRNEEPWEGKSICVFYVDMLTDLLKLVTYIVFFCFICYYYQLPIHIIRDVYVTFRSFIQKCRDLYRYQRATRNMNELYPDAMVEDFARTSDRTCIICREEMQPMGEEMDEEHSGQADARTSQRHHLDRPKKLPCGHIFHFRCLRSWLERQQSCPTCRRSVLPEGNGSPPEQNREQARNNNGEQNARGQSEQSSQQQQRFPQAGLFAALGEQQYGYTPIQPLVANAFGILTPDGNHPSSGIPPGTGMMPLVPIASAPFTAGQEGTIPESLTEEQLRILSTTTREAMIQRLRLLEALQNQSQAIQNQVHQAIQVLNQALSVMPNPDNDSSSSSRNPNNSSSEDEARVP